VQARVVRRGRVFRDYGLLPGRLPGARGYLGGEISCVSRTSRRTANGNGHAVLCLGTTILCATTLAVLLVIGGVEEDPGPDVESEKIMRVLCSGCDRILKSGT